VRGDFLKKLSASTKLAQSSARCITHAQRPRAELLLDRAPSVPSRLSAAAATLTKAARLALARVAGEPDCG